MSISKVAQSLWWLFSFCSDCWHISISLPTAEIFSPGCCLCPVSLYCLFSAVLLSHISVSAELGKYHATVCKACLGTNVVLGPQTATLLMNSHTEPHSAFGVPGYALSSTLLRSSPNSTSPSIPSVEQLSALRAFSKHTWRHLSSLSYI